MHAVNHRGENQLIKVSKFLFNAQSYKKFGTYKYFGVNIS